MGNIGRTEVLHVEDALAQVATCRLEVQDCRCEVASLRRELETFQVDRGRAWRNESAEFYAYMHDLQETLEKQMRQMLQAARDECQGGPRFSQEQEARLTLWEKEQTTFRTEITGAQDKLVLALKGEFDHFRSDIEKLYKHFTRVDEAGRATREMQDGMRDRVQRLERNMCQGDRPREKAEAKLDCWPLSPTRSRNDSQDGKGQREGQQKHREQRPSALRIASPDMPQGQQGAVRSTKRVAFQDSSGRTSASTRPDTSQRSPTDDPKIPLGRVRSSQEGTRQEPDHAQPRDNENVALATSSAFLVVHG